ncbi:WD40 repeat-containing protein [Histoplasma capsulatum var. duboisii H88]|uniref:WD domain-containing protein n=1 Tax=Ajellomyces capsulatus (strain H88) TaxID=544711 RepID=F0U8G4_AJEC8|nr:WD40 repeat-containing protein [Histoplasma capsulatum var. duboisii H88]QSS51862.1 WD domain-containing protein [Histoplasma capsulatum var. duboisii H88]
MESVTGSSSLYVRSDTPEGSQDTIPSSPPIFNAPQILSSPPRTKTKKPPPVTPRSFKRFFTPRSVLGALSSGGNDRPNRHILKDICSPALNRLGPAFSRISDGTQDNPAKSSHSQDDLLTPRKKRKLSISSSSSPLQSSPVRRVRIAPSIRQIDIDSSPRRPKVDEIGIESEIQSEVLKTKTKQHTLPPTPLRRSHTLQTTGQIFIRSLSGNTPGTLTHRYDYGNAWRDEVSDFYSLADDLHQCSYRDQRGERLTLPFCTVSCHTNSLVAIGDEEGGVRLLDSANDAKPGFSKTYLSFQPHTNSIMDLEFSSDDRLLATASGDQTSRIIDMTTQTQIYCLSKHTSSVKRVQFQPASNNNVVATCSRDGSVNIWDLRYKAFEKPAMQLRCSLTSDADDSARASTKMKYPQVSNSIWPAHAERARSKTGSEAEALARRDDISVTSIAFLHPGRENLFVTCGESNACVRLWDLRTTYSLRRKTPVPLAITRQPESHEKYRQFGLTSMAFSGNGSRLYTLCRDGSVYAYSTSHLTLGSCPEMTPSSSSFKRFPSDEAKPGLGPLYGFRHPHLQVATFFVKIAVRRAVNDESEMLAVGSSDNCAIVFPTDERYLPSPFITGSSSLSSSTGIVNNSSNQASSRPLHGHNLRSSHSSSVGLSGRLEDTIPIYKHGAALVEGHKKEVSGVSWTYGGELITVSDDLHARCWRKGPAARDLRIGGDGEGRRWRCGWADVKDSGDDEDE